MKKLPLVLGIVAVPVVIIAAGAIYVATFDANEHKELIVSKVKDATGLDLVLDGAIDLTLYPWLGLTVDQVSVKNPPGFSDNPLLHADHAAVRIKLMPMLTSDKFEIDTVRLDGVKVNLEVAGNGNSNWAASQADATDGNQPANEDGGAAAPNVILGGVDIRNTSVVYDNLSDNTHYEINDLNMQIGELVFGQPLDLTMSMQALSRKPQLRSDLALKGTVVYDLDTGLYQLEPLTLDATLSGPTVPNGSAKLALTTALAMNTTDDTLVLNNLQFSALDMQIAANLNASDISSDKPSVTGNLDASGNDLAVLFRILDQNELANRIRSLDSKFKIAANIDANMDTGEVKVPTLQASLLGATIDGNFNATAANTETPTITGNLKAQGPDLPTLIEVVGILQEGANSSLAQTGRDLSRVSNKRFSLEAGFTADMKEGNIELPALKADLIGFALNGTLKAEDINGGGGSIAGNLTMRSNNLRDVLRALNQPGLADIAQSLDLDVQLGGDGDNLRISPLKLSLVVAGGQLGNTPQTLALNADTEVNLENSRLTVDTFTLNGVGLDLSGSFLANDLSGDPSYEGTLKLPAFNARQFMSRLNLEAPVMADATVLQKVAAEADFVGTANSFNLNRLAMQLDDTTINGSVKLNDLTTMSGSFDIDIDTINADRYLPPPSETTTAADTGEASPLPVDDLRKLNVEGSLDIKQLTISGLQMSDISVPLKAADGVIALSPLKANLYEGSFNGDINLNVTGAESVAKVNTTLTSINLAPLMKDFMDSTYVSGKGNIELALESRGNDSKTIKRNINGSGKLALTDGVLTGVDVGGSLTAVETMIRSRQLVNPPQGGQTPFENFSATLAIANGVVSSNDLLIKAPGWQLTGAGTLADLEREIIDFDLVARVDPGTATVAEQQYDIGGHDLPIACSGALSSPRCLPDAKAIATAAVTNAVQDRLGSFLRDRLGGQQPQQQAQPNQAAPTDPNAPAPAQPPAEEPAQPPAEQPSAEQQLLNKALERFRR